MGDSNTVVDSLEEDGPLTRTNLPRKIDFRDKMQGVFVFEPTLTGADRGVGGGGKPEAVYYLQEHHPLEEVIRVWVDANKKVVDTAPRRAVTRAINHYGQEAREVWAEMVEEFY